MNLVSLASLFKNPPLENIVEVGGWVKSVRNSKAFSFLMLNDGSTQKDFQIILDGKLENYEELSKLTTGSCVTFKGKIVESGGKSQSVEMQAEAGTIHGATEEDYPLQKKGTSLEFLREIAHLRPRTNTMGAVFRVRNVLSYAIHRFFQEKGFLYLHSPIITTFDGEGAGAMFHVTTHDLDKVPVKEGRVEYEKDYFAEATNLCVTGQLEAEAFALGMSKVYTFGPTFRAENSNTARHLSEFWMIEPEVAFADLQTVATLGSEMIQFCLQEVLKQCPDEIAFFDKMFAKGLKERLEHVSTSAFKQITYTEAIDILSQAKKKFEYKVEWGADLQTEHERFLTEEHFKQPVIVTDYPKGIKAFYMRLNDDEKTVAAMDILVPGVGEIVGGSQREERKDILLQRIKDFDLGLEEYQWYVDLRRHGGCKHAGYGLGFERLVMYATGMTNIRDAIPFPRYPGSAKY